MADSSITSNKRIAKNTLFLYFRTFLIMVITLYTSRVILNALGVEDYGIYNVVGGLVTTFSILSGSISVSIVRFITFELGKEKEQNVNRIFASAINVQICIIIIIFILGETLGLWFLNNYMVFPENRTIATNLVFQFSIITFLVNLYSVPYNAAIIAYEKMSAFAYISIIEAILKLLIALGITYTENDKLIVYAILMTVTSLIIRIIYGIYCRKNCPGCFYKFILDKSILKNMFSYAGWTYVGASAAILRDQGGNILINIFFGPTINAARGIATQVQSAITQFSQNFTTALNPQITKNYAANNNERVIYLIRMGALISYFLLLIISIPILFNTPYILKLWLKEVPDETIIFVRLILIFILSESISNPLITAASATNKIRNYQLIVGGIQFLNFPISYFFLHIGFSAYSIFIIAIILSQCCLVARLYILRKMIGLSIKNFLIYCYVKIICVTILSLILPIISITYQEENFLNLLGCTLTYMIYTTLIIYFIGCSKQEKNYISNKLHIIIQKLKNK